MTTTPPLDATSEVASPAAGTHQVTVAGHLDDHWAAWLDGHRLIRNDDGSTTVTFMAVDQAQLHGVLSRIRDLGADLLGLHVIDHQRVNGSAGVTHGRSDPGAARTPSSSLQRSLHTERLTLRPATAADAEATWTYRRLDSVNEWLTGVPGTLEEYWSTFAEPARLAATVIVEHADTSGRQVIGDFMLRLEDAWSQLEVTERAKDAQAEVGWVLDPAHTGFGYATEGVRGLLRYCFEELSVHRVVANCFLDNDASWRLMERVGMRRETHAVRDSLHRSGQWLDTVAYAVLRDEWERHSTSPSETKESAS